jgi:hypothetical protein
VPKKHVFDEIIQGRPSSLVPRSRSNGAMSESDPTESLALREGKTDRSIRMTLSLAFPAPDIRELTQ